MTTLLQIDSSLFGHEGQSARLTDAFVRQWRRREPDARVIRRDLAALPPSHLNLTRFQAAGTAPGDRTPEQAAEAGLADTLVDELMTTDVLVIGAPLYNFHIPSTLKSWLDYVCRAGRTFRYTEDGPQGLLPVSHAHVFVTSGGRYAGSEAEFAAPYLKHVLGFLGIETVTVTYAEGLAMGDEVSRAALEAAGKRIEQLAA